MIRLFLRFKFISWKVVVTRFLFGVLIGKYLCNKHHRNNLIMVFTYG